MKGYVKLCADDTKLYYMANSIYDYKIIQSDLDELNQWSDKWLLRVNAKKCKVMYHSSSDAQYSMKAIDCSTCFLDHVLKESDLGIIFDTKLSFNEHIAHVVIKANCMIGIMKDHSPI